MEIIILIAVVWVGWKVLKALLVGYGKSDYRRDR